MDDNNSALAHILEFYPDEQFLKADGLDGAVLGVDVNSMRLVYSEERIIEILQERDGMTQEEALEFYEFNIKTAYVGELTPIYIKTFF